MAITNPYTDRDLVASSRSVHRHLSFYVFPTPGESDVMHGVSFLSLSKLLFGSSGCIFVVSGYLSTTEAEHVKSTSGHRKSLFGTDLNSDALGMGLDGAMAAGGRCTSASPTL